MIIEYTATAVDEIKGNGWTAYRRHKSGVTRIFWDIWVGLRDCKTVPYRRLPEIIESARLGSFSRAYCRVSFDDKIIDINQHGVLPIVWIIPDDSPYNKNPSDEP